MIFLNIKKSVKNIWTLFLNLIFPIECVGCEKEDVWICERCLRTIEFNAKQTCPECKKENEWGNYCIDCQKKFMLSGVLVACSYENKKIAKLIKLYKYNFVREISPILAKLLVRFVRNLLIKNSLAKNEILSGELWRKFDSLKNTPNFILDFSNVLIIPVPLHKRRRRWRGFNQSEEIAKLLAEHFGLEIDLISLQRKKYTSPQAKHNREQRITNLKDCFKWIGPDISRRNILLIDDVVSTGVTLKECATVLKSVGVNEVWGLVVASN